MNKKHIFFLFLINLFSIANLYSTIIRTVVLKHKKTGQQIVLYGDVHWGLDDFRKKDNVQFDYIAQFIEKNKENIPGKLAILYEAWPVSEVSERMREQKDLLLDKIMQVSKASWKDFACCLETRNAFDKICEEGKGLDTLCIFDEFIERMTPVCANLPIGFKEIANKMLENIKSCKQELHDFWLESLSDELSEIQKLELPIKDHEKYRREIDVFKLIGTKVRIQKAVIEDFFDLNAMCQIAAHNEPFIAVFAGDMHALNLKDNLIKYCNYELKHDSGMICQNKKYENLASVSRAGKVFTFENGYLESELTPLVEPIENINFDRMLLPWVGNLDRFVAFLSTFIAG